MVGPETLTGREERDERAGVLCLLEIFVYEFHEKEGYQFLTRVQMFTVPNGLLRNITNYRDIFRPGKDGRDEHRFRVVLPNLAGHEEWRWREFRYERHGVIVTH